MIRAALALAQRGLAVFPCRPQDKRPATANGLKDATGDLDIIRQWWQQEPRFNPAIATGSVSGIFVVDIDGLDAESELRRLEAEHGEFPSTIEAITARGRHVYFCLPEIPVRNSASKIAPGIDVRGDGGYVLAPPSIHPSGRRYAWSVDSANAIAAAPDWLVNKITGRANGSAAPATPTEWHQLITADVPEGTRNSTLTRLTGHLLRRFVDAIVVHELVQSWNVTHCKPPLSMEDVERVVASIAQRELKRRTHG